MPVESITIPCPLRTTTAAEVLPLRIGLLMDHPSPHMLPLLEALERREDAMVQVFYCGSSAPERRWGAPTGPLPYRILNGATLPAGIRFNPLLLSGMQRARVDIWVVNSVYTSPSTLGAVWWLERMQKPWVFMNEPPQLPPGMLSSIKTKLIAALLRRASGVIGTGRSAEKVYRSLMVGDKKTESVPYYMDLKDFYRLPLASAPEDGADLQLVTMCRMIRRKGIDVLLGACRLLPPRGWRLTLVGDGPLRRKLQGDFARIWPAGQVHFAGELPYQERLRAFGGKHLFVFPSRFDGWGMVVPEALAAGLPVISGDRVGSAMEFVRDGENGYLVPPGDPEALADRIGRFIENPASIPRMAAAARRSLIHYTPEEGVRRLIRFLQGIAAGTHPAEFDNRLSPSSPPTWEQLATPVGFQSLLAARAREKAKTLVISASCAFRPRRKSSGHKILVYHLVLPEDRNRFEEHLKFLADHFAMCTVEELLRAASHPVPGGEYRAAMTFDDGFRILLGDCVEMLDKYRVKATFFVPTAFIGAGRNPEVAARFSLRNHNYRLPLEPMRPEDLALLVAMGHEIGSHGTTHSSISAMTGARAKRELQESRAVIEEWTGASPATFAYPYGEIHSSVGDPAQWLRNAGYRCGLTLRRGAVGPATNPMRLPRHHAEGWWPLNRLRYFLLD